MYICTDGFARSLSARRVLLIEECYFGCSFRLAFLFLLVRHSSIQSNLG